MKRFQFKLARLARVRTIEEEIARGEWQVAEAEAREAEARLQGVIRDLEEALGVQRAAQTDSRVLPRVVLGIADAIARLEAVQETAREAALRAREAAEAARRPWQALRAELEGLRRLEKKARTEHRVTAEREDTKAIDQLASERAQRQIPVWQRERASTAPQDPGKHE